jgi:hypothetical protein
MLIASFHYKLLKAGDHGIGSMHPEAPTQADRRGLLGNQSTREICSNGEQGQITSAVVGS